MALTFPRRFSEVSGSRSIHYALYSADSVLIRSAACTVPDSREAMEEAFKRLRLAKAKPLKTKAARTVGVRTMGLTASDPGYDYVYDPGCECYVIEEIIVEGDPDPEEPQWPEDPPPMDPGPSLPGPGVPQDPPRPGGDGGGGPCTTCVPPDSVVACTLDPTSYPFEAQVFSDPALQSDLNALWQRTNAYSEDQTKRREQAGWVILQDGHYSIMQFEQVQDGVVYRSCYMSGVRPGRRPDGTVAFIHSHPFTDGELIKDPLCYERQDEHPVAAEYPLEYISEASKADHFLSQFVDLPGFLIDHNGVLSFSGPYDWQDPEHRSVPLQGCSL